MWVDSASGSRRWLPFLSHSAQRAPRLRSPDFLRLMLAWRMQAAVHGGIDAELRNVLARKGAVELG